MTGQESGADGTPELGRGTQIALGILLVWFGGLLLFVALMSGKTPSLTIGTSKDGKPQGPRDASELLGRLAGSVQAAQGSAAPPGGTSV